MEKILVIGASGFLGKKVAHALVANGYPVRCLARKLSRAEDLARAGCEVMQGDVSDSALMQSALVGVRSVYISIHTISPQPASKPGQGFMDVEMTGLQNIVTACRAHGADRLIYVTSVGIAPDAPSVWLRERWKAEQFLLRSGLAATVIRPGQIVGVGGMGFNTMVRQAKSLVTFNLFGGGRMRMRAIAVEDLVYYLIGVLDDTRTYGQAYDVGCDDLLSKNQMIDVTAELLGRRRPIKLDVPRSVFRTIAPVLERSMQLPAGAIRGFLDSMKTEPKDDPLPIRGILPRPLLSYREAVARALAVKP